MAEEQRKSKRFLWIGIVSYFLIIAGYCFGKAVGEGQGLEYRFWTDTCFRIWVWFAPILFAGIMLLKTCIRKWQQKSYEFIQNLSDELEVLIIMADTMGPGIKFDCTWLLKYQNLQTLWLGKKAKKNIESISRLSKLKSLCLRGIKLTDLSFLYKLNLEKLALLWNSNNNLHELANLKNLKELELWRINKLSDISFIEELTNLEILKLQDLKHINCLPD